MDTDALQPILAGVVRHGLTSLGGALVAGGYMDSSDTTAFVGGGMVVAGVLWSWWQKRGQAKVLAIIAKMHPVAPASASTNEAVKAATQAAKAVASILLVAFAVSLLVGTGSAQAAERREFHPAVTGNIPNDIATDLKGGVPAGTKPSIAGVTLTGDVQKDAEALWQKIASASSADLTYSAAMAKAANTSASQVRYQCWEALITANQQANGVGLKNPDGSPMPKPDPHLFTDVETAAEVIDNLSPQGALYTSCSGAAQLAKANVLTFISAAVTGAAGLAAMPTVPGL
jgi:hypothetical protein